MMARPILMHARSIQNLLAGRKTQTRRIIKRLPSGVSCIEEPSTYPGEFEVWKDGERHPSIICPYGVPGDLLWVRESIKADKPDDDSMGEGVRYLADNGFILTENEVEPRRRWWKIYDYNQTRGATVPSIHMPKWASRLTLRLTEVRAERVQSISHTDIVAEGWERGGWPSCSEEAHRDAARDWWMDVWDATNGAGAWKRNDYCWCLTFEVLRENVDAALNRIKVAA